MYKVLIVDDESLIRDGLKCIMDWEAMGFCVCGEASNGEEALRLILSQQPDLVLMDIRMPKMQGLEVVKAVRQQDFKGRFIITSGYSDFKYAQEAMRYGVEFYLTKPIEEEELSTSVHKIKLSLDSEVRSSDNLELLKKKAKNVILKELLTGKEGVPDSLDEADIADLELDADIYQVVIYENFSRELGSTFYSFAELLKVSNRDDHTFHHIEDDRKDIILLKGTYAINRFQDFLAHYDKATPPQKGSPMDSLFLAYGRPVYTLHDIHYSYSDACMLISRRFFCKPGQHTLGYSAFSGLRDTPPCPSARKSFPSSRTIWQATCRPLIGKMLQKHSPVWSSISTTRRVPSLK